jgi:hypothetical protein
MLKIASIARVLFVWGGTYEPSYLLPKAIAVLSASHCRRR